VNLRRRKMDECARNDFCPYSALLNSPPGGLQSPSAAESPFQDLVRDLSAMRSE